MSTGLARLSLSLAVGFRGERVQRQDQKRGRERRGEGEGWGEGGHTEGQALARRGWRGERFLLPKGATQSREGCGGGGDDCPVSVALAPCGWVECVMRTAAGLRRGCGAQVVVGDAKGAGRCGARAFPRPGRRGRCRREAVLCKETVSQTPQAELQAAAPRDAQPLTYGAATVRRCR